MIVQLIFLRYQRDLPKFLETGQCTLQPPIGKREKANNIVILIAGETNDANKRSSGNLIFTIYSTCIPAIFVRCVFQYDILF